MQLVRRICLLNFTIAFANALAAEYHVAINGTPGALGTPGDPLSFSRAISSGGPGRAGDTIWLHGGIYRGAFTGSVTGEPGKPVIVRQYPGERATIDNTESDLAALTINGAWAWYWGFEVMNSSTNRVTPRAAGVNIFGASTKCINLVVHDSGVGIGLWSQAINSEVYGCIVYNNGWQGTGKDRGHGHAIYAQNEVGTKQIRDNILFNQFGYGVHIYTEKGAIHGFDLEGNVSFNNGVITRDANHYDNYLVGGYQPADRITLRQNYGYYTPHQGGRNLELGFHATNNAVIVESNFFADGSVTIKWWTNVAVAGNTFASSEFDLRPIPGGKPWIWRDNFTNQNPAGVQAIVRGNLYETNRANLIVFNWDLKEQVQVDLRGFLQTGALFEVRNAEDFFGPPVLKGKYSEQPIALPMKDLHCVQALGVRESPTATWPQFGVFVVLPVP